jgi:hypothetical protein
MIGLAIAVSCGGRVTPDDTGSGGAGGSGAGGTTGTGGGVTGGSTTGTGGGTTGTTTSTGGSTTGTGGGTTGTTTGTGGGTTTGTGGSGGGVGGTGGAGGAIDPGPEYSACTGSGQCELVPAKCCLCGTIELGLVAAINSTKRDAYVKQTCGTNPGCPPCVGAINPHLMARCEAGRCVGFDVSKDPPHTKCASNQECILRKGLACCECQAPGDWVAVSRTGAMLVTSESCAPQSVCADCAPMPPVGTSAVCRNNVCERIP